MERNLIVGNREGFNFREQSRTTPRIGNKEEVPVWNHNELIRHNIIALNRDAQVWGWFDVKDNRHWPAAVRSGDQVGNISAGLKPGEREGEPPTLEELRLRFEQNDYFAAPGQGWFEWGVTWRQHKRYRNLSDFQAGLGIDVGSWDLHPHFANVLARDYRLSSEAMGKLEKNYPQGPVPGVILGSPP